MFLDDQALPDAYRADLKARVGAYGARYLARRNARSWLEQWGACEDGAKQADIDILDHGAAAALIGKAPVLLDHLENHGRRERMSLENLSIEHILPQTRNLSPAWKNALGHAWQHAQEQWVHTLGNLTLSAYNTEIADRPFAEKRDMKGGYRDSPLRLNAALREARIWNEEAIVARGHALADQALAIWPLPCLAADERDVVRNRPGDPGSYRIEDHPCILPGAPMHDLFEVLRRAILDLDSGVYECPRRHYIAYKGSTNIVDIVPKKTRLQLTLNTRFRDLDDPAGLATDCTYRHFWGNGDALVMLEDRRQIPYVMDLVRQVFNRQIHRDPGKHAALRTGP